MPLSCQVHAVTSSRALPPSRSHHIAPVVYLTGHTHGARHIQDNITYQDFVQTRQDARMIRVFEKLGVQLTDADRLMYHLSAAGTKEVALSTLVRGVIMLNDVASKMDTLEGQMNSDLARRKIIASERLAFGKKDTMLRSLRGKMPLQVMHLPSDAITRRLQALCRVMPFHQERSREVMSVSSLSPHTSGGRSLFFNPPLCLVIRTDGVFCALDSSFLDTFGFIVWGVHQITRSTSKSLS